jgi:hypothetical protein
MPRHFDDALGPLTGGSIDDWPGQVEIALCPGSAVVIDSALYHTAKRGTAAGIRYLWGGHFQGWSDSRAHGEDQEMDCLRNQFDLMERFPGFAKLVRADSGVRDDTT